MMVPDPLAARLIPEQASAIPSIDLAELPVRRLDGNDFQYGTIGSLSDILGRNPIAHRHDRFLQLHYVEKGGFELFNDAQHTLASGPAIFVTPPAVPHAFAFSPEAEGHVLTLHQQLVHRILERDPALPGPERLIPFCRELAGADSRAIDRKLSALFGLLDGELDESAPGSQSACEGLVQAILGITLRLQPGDDAPHSSGARRHLPLYRRFLGLVEQHYRAHLPVSFFAEQIGLTEWHLFELVRDCGGTSPKALLSERLLQEAKRQLAFSTASVKEVAAHLGFSDTAYFCRLFRKRLGTTPSLYRKQVQAGQGESQKSPT